MKNPKLLTYIFNGLVLAALVWAGFKYLNGVAISEALEHINISFIPVLILLALVYLLLKTWRFALTVKAVADLPFIDIAKAYVASQPITLLPGGITSRAIFLNQIGIPVGTAVAPVLLISLLDQFVFILGLFVAAFLFEGARTSAFIALTVLILAVFLFSFPLTRHYVIGAIKKIGHRYHFAKHLKEFGVAVDASTEPLRLLSLLALTVVDFFLVILLLDISLQSIGIQIDYSVLFLAYILPTMVGRFTVLPAGVGLTEAGMVGILATLGGGDINLIAAGVAIFRIASIVMQSSIGALVYFISWKPLLKKT